MGASTVTLAEALTNIRTFLDEPNPQFWTNAQLTAYINMGQADVQRKAEALEQKGTIAVVANQQTYTAPTDTFRIYRIEYIQTGSQQTYTLEFRGYNEMDAVWGTYQQYPGSFPSYYTLWINPPAIDIVTYPVPAEAGTMNVYYYRQPLPVVLTTDTLDCLPGFEDVIYDYVVYRAYRQDANPMWSDQFKLYEEHLLDMISMSRVFTDQANYFSTGSSNLPSWLVGGYVD
jgi:hypothetical protein